MTGSLSSGHPYMQSYPTYDGSIRQSNSNGPRAHVGPPTSTDSTNAGTDSAFGQGALAESGSLATGGAI
jgi:hypothetical protein